jgi:cytoskeletal protein RodZ
MSSLHNRQAGFSAVIIVVLVAVIGLVGYLGYTFYTNSQQQAADTPTEQSAVAEGVQVAPVVESSSDLDTALTALEATDTSSSSDTAELETGLSAF